MSEIARAIEEDFAAWEKQDSVWVEPESHSYDVYSYDGEIIGHYTDPCPSENVYFWCSGMHKPRPTPSAKWNFGLDEQKSVSWECPYCNSLHPLTEYKCANCGAARIKEY